MSILDPDILIEKAQQLVRSDDLLGHAWEPAFRVLVESIEREAGHHPSRIEKVVPEMLGLLATRGRVAAMASLSPRALPVASTTRPQDASGGGVERSFTPRSASHSRESR